MTHRDEDEQSLWSFTLDRYGRPGMQNAVIALQENHNADVNVLFYCVWCAATGRGPLDAGAFETIDRLIAPWRDGITKPLRRLRNRIKTDPALTALEGAMDVRGKILAAEIDSERIAQIVIESTAVRPMRTAVESPAATAELNLRTYLSAIGAVLDERGEEDLKVLVHAVLPE